MSDTVYDGTVTRGSAVDGTITEGGVAQALGTTSTHGWAVYNPSSTDALWVSSSVTAAPNAPGCIYIPPLGGYETPSGYRPCGYVSLWGAVTGQPYTARGW